MAKLYPHFITKGRGWFEGKAKDEGRMQTRGKEILLSPEKNKHMKGGDGARSGRNKQRRRNKEIKR